MLLEPTFLSITLSYLLFTMFHQGWDGVVMREGKLSGPCALGSQLCRAWDRSHQFLLKGKKEMTVNLINLEG